MHEPRRWSTSARSMPIRASAAGPSRSARYGPQRLCSRPTAA